MNVLLFFYLLLIAPKLLFDRLLKGKRHPGFLQRLGFHIPTSTKPVIWIHAISVGEVKAAQPLLLALREQEPHAFFLITTTTATGQAEAKRTLSSADAISYFPLDFTWVVRRWVAQLKPRHFILIESDFWWNLLAALKKNGTHISLVSGKMSERSARRFHLFSSFSKKLFAHFDLLCLQNETYLQRFTPLVPDPTRLHVTGNLKLDLQPQPLSAPLTLPQPTITVSCTHAPEEELILDALSPDWFLLLAPRHPERFEEVAHLLIKKKIPFSRWSQPTAQKGRVLLVDTMGQLPLCYSLSRLAIVGGSYVDHVGGHNVLEPCLYGIPVLFGPHTQGQAEFAARALEAGAALRVPLDQLRTQIELFFQSPSREQAMKEAASQLIQSGRGSTQRTLNAIFSKKPIGDK